MSGMTHDNFRATIVRKTQILRYLLTHDSMGLEDFRKLFPEHSKSTSDRAFDKLWAAGYLVQCQNFQKHPRYRLDESRRDVCEKMVKYYTRTLKELQDEKDSNL